MADPTVDILLATHNGADYLAAQLDSIVAQTVANWRLIARDDGSCDGTPAILHAFQARHPARTTLLEDRDGRLGVIGNYARLMRSATADYVALCDQDDVWLPEKLQVSVERMRTLERRYGGGTPLLVFSDLIVVDANLQEIAPSFWKYQHLDPSHARTFNKLVPRNVATGCTMLLNSPLVEAALPFPAPVMMHDWWIAMVAAAFGSADFLPQATILYRQHAANVAGATVVSFRTVPSRVVRLIRDYDRVHRVITGVFEQARAFHERYGRDLPEENRRTLELFIQISDAGPIWRPLLAVKCRARSHGAIRSGLLIGLSRGALHEIWTSMVRPLRPAGRSPLRRRRVG